MGNKSVLIAKKINFVLKFGSNFTTNIPIGILTKTIKPSGKRRKVSARDTEK